MKTVIDMAHLNGSNDNSELIRERTGFKKLNTQGLEMICVEYKNSKNITVEFNNPHYITKSNWRNFSNGKIRNPYVKSIYGVGIIGLKYPTNNGKKSTKEYQAWKDMLFRVYGCKTKDTSLMAYKDCIVCDDWLNYELFYEWLHKQKNFDKWLNGEHWCVDKDIITNKGNKIYTPEYCCLVPNNVNTLFVKKNANRGSLPIGVTTNHKRYMAMCSNPIIGNSRVYLGTFDTPEEAFYAYKKYKEMVIKQVAEIEYAQGNITKECYNAMLKYKVEITD